MRVNKSVLAILILISLTSTISAQQQTLGGEDGYSPRSNVELIQVCGNCTFVNITSVKLGDGSLLAIEKPMKGYGSFYNYTFSGGNTTSTGQYIVNWVADPDGITTAGNFDFYIRKGGLLLSTGQAILYIFLILFSFLVFLLFLILSFKIPYSDKKTKDGAISKLVSFKYLKLLSIWICAGIFVWFLSLLSAVMNTFSYLEAAYTLVTNVYIFFLFLQYGITFLVLSLLFIESWKDLLVPLFKKVLKKFVPR